MFVACFYSRRNLHRVMFLKKTLYSEMNTGPNYENFKSPRVCGVFLFPPENFSYFFEKQLANSQVILITLQI